MRAPEPPTAPEPSTVREVSATREASATREVSAEREGSIARLARPAVHGLARYLPGKPIAELERELGLRDIIKLASNENPHGPSPAALEAMRAALTQAWLYPDNSCHELTVALARHLGVERQSLTIGNGSNELLLMLADAFLSPDVSAVYAQFSFVTYRIATAKSGARAIEVPALPRGGPMPLGHDLRAMAAAVAHDTRLLFIANPNNPTGTWAASAEVKRLLEIVPTRTLVVLDEAYLEFSRMHGAQDAQPWLAEHPNLVLLRTFSKAYGLAGMRVGYALSHPDVADLLSRVRPPFTVSMPAQAAAIAALADQRHMQHSVTVTCRELERVRVAIGALGLWSAPSAANFLLVEFGAEAPQTLRALHQRGIIVRSVADYGLPQFLRISIGLPEHNDRLLQALRDIAPGAARRARPAP